MGEQPENFRQQKAFFEEQNDKFKQRQALENMYTNFVQSKVEVKLPSVPSNSYSFSSPSSYSLSGLWLILGWLTLTFYCCGLLERKQKR